MTTENKDGWPEKFILFPRLERVGAAILRLVRPEEDDNYVHPLDQPIEPVIDWPEHKLGHSVMQGELTAQQAYDLLGGDDGPEAA